MSLIPTDLDTRMRSNNDGVMDEILARGMIDAETEQVGFDFLGALSRRKFIILILIALAAAIGYLLYTQQSPQYASKLRVMIWNQAPPSIVNGELMEDEVYLPKHQNLMASELVLSDAIENGKLTELETFRSSPAPLLTLRSMLKIVPVDKQWGDSLDITCTGSYAAELPTILTEVVQSYIRVINEDTAAIGKESVTLIEKLRDSVVEEKKSAEVRYFELMKKHELSSENENGQLVNPFLDKYTNLTEQRDFRQREERDMIDRVSSLDQLKTVGLQNRAVLVKAIVLEAEKYLQLGAASTTSNGQPGASDLLSRMHGRLESLEITTAELQKKANFNGQSYGELHPATRKISNEIEFYKTQAAALKAEIARLQNEAVLAEPKKVDSNTAQHTAEDNIIRLYFTALTRERERHFSAVRSLNQELKALEEPMDRVSADMTELNLLRTQIKEKERSVREILDRLAEITVVASNFTSTKIRIIDWPLPGGVVAPVLRNYLLFATLIGGFLGTALALVIDHADLTYRNPYEIFNKMGVPVISRIPLIKADRKNRGSTHQRFNCSQMLSAALNPRSPAAEAFRTTRTALLFFSQQTGAKAFLLTSPSAGDGKSTTVSNLAVSIAQSGKRVVVLDADLRRPRIHKYFGIEVSPGVVDFADGKVNLDEITQTSAIHENLFVVTSGSKSENPGEFVVSAAFREVMAGLKDRFDIVLVDSPPLLPVADATALSTLVDGVVLVFRIRKGVMLASQKARDLLDLVHAKMLGIIVNGVDENPYYNEYGAYGYGSGYSSSSRYYDSESKKYYEDEKV